MPVYGSAQSGFNPSPNQGLNISSLEHGTSLVLFSGSEASGLNVASISFTKGNSPTGGPLTVTFNMSGASNGTTVDVQCADKDLASHYTKLTTLSPDTNGNAAYTDVGNSPFYRVVISAFAGGSTPAVTASCS